MAGKTCLVMGLLIMGPEGVLAEVVFQIAPNGMDVVGVILGVVEFHQE